jgi:hypothetical protein
MRTARLIAAAAALLALSSGALAEVRPVIIDNDHGGQVDTFAMWYGRLRVSGTPVVLRGMCESACTLVLTLPPTQVCVEPTASLGFHLATIGERPEPEVTDALIRRYYPEAVQKWLATRKLRAVPTYMTAAEIVAAGIFPACAPHVTPPDPDDG